MCSIISALGHSVQGGEEEGNLLIFNLREKLFCDAELLPRDRRLYTCPASTSLNVIFSI
jgi:hypothetical protein